MTVSSDVVTPEVLKEDLEFYADETVTLVTVTYNSAHCLEAIAPIFNQFKHTILVDNASNDLTADLATTLMPQVKLIRNKQNRGFGAANNTALRQVQTQYALLLNPDCLPSKEAAISLVLSAGDFPEAAIIAPHLIRRDGSTEVSYRWPHTKWLSRGPAADGPCCVGFVCGAAMLLNMEVMREIGFFDETFFLYYEDEDLCQRVFNAKREIILVPDVAITHLSRGSVKGRNPLKSEFIRGYHHAQSKLIFEHKHVSASSTAALRWKTLGLAVLTLLPRLLAPQPKYLARLLGRIVGLAVFKLKDENSY